MACAAAAGGRRCCLYLSVIETIRNNASGEGVHVGSGLGFVGSIRQHARQRWNLRDPAAVSFTFDLNLEHWISYRVRLADTNRLKSYRCSTRSRSFASRSPIGVSAARAASRLPISMTISAPTMAMSICSIVPA